MTDLVKLETGMTDAEKAEDIRARARPLLEQVAALCAEAQRSGMRLDFQIAPDGFGRHTVTTLSIVKLL